MENRTTATTANREEETVPENERQETRAFEDLRIFKEARTLANRICTLTRTEAFSRDYALRDQMRRSAISILSNIAEGYERETAAEFVRFLYIAKGSCGELRAQVMLAFDQKFLEKQDYDQILSMCRKLSVGIYHLIVYLRKKQPARKQKRVED